MSSRATSLLSIALMLACCMFLGGCVTMKMWDARDERTLVSLPDNSRGEPATLTEMKFANNVVGLVLTPLTLILDIVLFPVQIIGGYRPYGDKR